MKWLVFLLLLGNLLFFAYTEGYFGKPSNPDAVRILKQVRPDDVRVVSRDLPPSGTPEAAKPEISASTLPVEPTMESTNKPASEASTVKPTGICLAWSGLSAKDADRLTDLLKGKFDDFKLARRAEPTSGKTWWVYIPPLATRADADKKAGELKQLGIKDFVVVQDSAPRQLAISLGVFSTEAIGKARLAELREKGVKSAKLEPYGDKEDFLVEARGAAGRQQAITDAIAALFTTKLEAKPCQ